MFETAATFTPDQLQFIGALIVGGGGLMLWRAATWKSEVDSRLKIVEDWKKEADAQIKVLEKDLDGVALAAKTVRALERKKREEAENARDKK